MSKFNLVAAGDVLLHSRVYDLYKKKDGTYDFSEPLKHAKKLLHAGDITIVNLESIVAGSDFGLSTYPKFNNPLEIAQILKDYGTDIVSVANNHAYDHREEGLLKSLENLQKIGLAYVGGYVSKKDRDTPRIIQKNGLKIAFLSFTREFKAFTKLDKNKDYLLNIFSESKIIPFRNKIRKFADSGIADIVVVSLHFGKEYILYPTALQREIAAEISDAGADVILGHHPHVLQPPEIIINSRGKKTFFIPSLGNFYTGQFGIYRQIGAALNLEVEKRDGNPIINFKPAIDLTYIDTNKRFTMYSFIDYVKEHPFLQTRHGNFESLKILTEITNRLRMNIPDLIIR